MRLKHHDLRFPEHPPAPRHHGTRNASPLSNAYYRGQKAPSNRVNIAFAYIGDMQLEVIEWNSLTRPYFTVIESMVKSADAKQLVREFRLADITPKSAAFPGVVKFPVKKLFGRVQQTRCVSAAA